MIESNIYLEMILHTNLDLTNILHPSLSFLTTIVVISTPTVLFSPPIYVFLSHSGGMTSPYFH